MNRRGIALCSALAIAAGLAGCRVHVDKDSNGREKTVQVDTPFGGVHVNTDQLGAADLGLPVYPGAQLEADKDNNKSADVHMGFGEWQLRVRAVRYSSSDSRDKVAAYYKQALGRFGDVITCDGSAPVGTPLRTAEGLTCSEDKNTNFKFNDKNVTENGNFQLKAGSRRHQHIVGFDDPKDGRTQFSLVVLDLPAAMDDKKD